MRTKVVGLVLGTLLALSAVAAAQTLEQYGAWTVKRSQDRFTDEITMMAYVQGKGSFMRPTLLIFCSDLEGTAWGVGVGMQNVGYALRSKVDVTYRVDSKPSVTGTWDASVETVGPIASEAERFLSELVGGTTLILRVTDSSPGPISELSIYGFADAMRAIGCYTGAL